AVPYGVPIPIHLQFRIIARPDAVSLDAGCAHFEMPGAAAISASVEVEPDGVRMRVSVATGRGRHDGFRIRVEATDTAIDCLVVVEYTYLGCRAWFLALVWLLLREIGERDRWRPDRIGEIPVDGGRPRGASSHGHLLASCEGSAFDCHAQHERQTHWIAHHP